MDGYWKKKEKCKKHILRFHTRNCVSNRNEKYAQLLVFPFYSSSAQSLVLHIFKSKGKEREREKNLFNVV